jgi:flagellar L-ring protein precursor FlgH
MVRLSFAHILAITASIALMAIGTAGADSLFSAQSAKEGTLISNQTKTLEVGDIVTVLVRENIDARTQSDTDTKKESEVEGEAGVDENTFLTQGLDLAAKYLPVWHIEAENEHRTDGRTQRSNRLVTTISCTVTEVFDNNNARIEGTKRVTVNREDSEILVQGLIRARDVSSANTVTSDQVADAVIELKGRGPLWNNQRRGLITRLLDWFSPF